MNDLSELIFILLQPVLWLTIIFLFFSWFISFFFPKAKWHKKILWMSLRLVFIAPFKKIYQAGRWLTVKIFTTQPDYRVQQIYLEDYPVTPLAFYDALEEVFQQRQIIGMEISRITRLEWHLLSARRVYLLIGFREAVCFIGALPLGTSFLVSWRFSAQPGKALLILFQVPGIGAIIEQLLAPLTFYRTDIYYAFEQVIRSTILETTQLLTQQGLRPLDENEQQPLLREFYE